MVLSQQRSRPDAPRGARRTRAGIASGRASRHRISATRTELFLPPRLPLDTWREIGVDLSVLWDASTWWQGDWLLYGQDRFPERYKHAVENSGLDYQTLRNYAWIARKFPPLRRRPNLSMQHHAEVASLPEDEQDRWLDRAESELWSRNKLRSLLRGGRVDGRALTAETLSLRVDASRRMRWARAAERDGQDLSEWITRALDRATEDVMVRRT